jgi:hypothetical protein
MKSEIRHYGTKPLFRLWFVRAEHFLGTARRDGRPMVAELAVPARPTLPDIALQRPAEQGTVLNSARCGSRVLQTLPAYAGLYSQ